MVSMRFRFRPLAVRAVVMGCTAVVGGGGRANTGKEEEDEDEKEPRYTGDGTSGKNAACPNCCMSVPPTSNGPGVR